MKNPHPTQVGRGYYASGNRASLGADFEVAAPGGFSATAKDIPDWLAFSGVLAVGAGAVYLGARFGARLLRR